MAYDGYRDSEPAPYSSSYDSYPDLDPYQSASYQRRQPADDAHRSRASSNDRSEGSQRGQPVYDAVNNAFDKSEAVGQIDPQLVAQITEQVRKQVIDTLKTSGQLPTQAPAQPKPNFGTQSPAGSGSTSFPPRDVYTPPSPIRHESIYSSGGPTSPEPVDRDPFKPAREPLDPATRYAPPKKPSPPPVDTSQYVPSSFQYETQRPPQARPKASRHLTEVEETAIEKTWGQLFDGDGQPTARLGQFLRGLAIHLINDYEPKHSIVVTPDKMLKFYEDTRVYDETYPWQTIFSTMPYSIISKLYRDLRCQHHFVQDGDQFDKMPDIPGLTPNGFQCWMARQIQAHPEAEFERLSKALQDMPISNADDIKERFPKEISRRLFPKKDNLQCRQLVAAALSCDGQVAVRSAPMPPPPGPPPQSQTPQYTNYPPESAAVTSDDENSPCAVPIERERKPYSAQVGGGKVYNDFSDAKPGAPPSTTGSTINSPAPDPVSATMNRPHRSSSTASTAPPPSSYHSVRTSDYPPSTTQTRSRHRNSTAHGATSGRRRSPSFSRAAPAYGTKSDGNIASGSVNAEYYTSSNIYSDPDEERSRPREFARDGGAGSGGGAGAGVQGRQRGYSGSRRTSVYDEDYYRGYAVGAGGQGPPRGEGGRY